MGKKRRKFEGVTPERVEKLIARVKRLKNELREVNASPFTKLGKAYVIFSQYPEIETSICDSAPYLRSWIDNAGTKDRTSWNSGSEQE